MIRMIVDFTQDPDDIKIMHIRTEVETGSIDIDASTSREFWAAEFVAGMIAQWNTDQITLTDEQIKNIVEYTATKYEDALRRAREWKSKLN